MRVGIAGGGSIATLFLEHIGKGTLGDTEVVAILGREASARTRQLARTFAVPFMTDIEDMIRARPDAVVEAAAHEWVERHAERVLRAGIGLIVLSAGAMADDGLRMRLEGAARSTGALLYVPSGGIGALDAIKAAAVAGLDEVAIRTAKPPRAWR
ncbi:MAG: aspartate dehydrogenase, partial [Betaproteobacteria bacterium]